jgi:hypothetical protein
VSLYFALMTCAVALLVATFWAAGPGWRFEMVRLLLGAATCAAALATWGTAIFIAYVYRVTWPILVLTGLVLVAGGGFAFWCHTNAQLASRFA